MSCDSVSGADDWLEMTGSPAEVMEELRMLGELEELNKRKKGKIVWKTKDNQFEEICILFFSVNIEGTEPTDLYFCLFKGR